MASNSFLEHTVPGQRLHTVVHYKLCTHCDYEQQWATRQARGWEGLDNNLNLNNKHQTDKGPAPGPHYTILTAKAVMKTQEACNKRLHYHGPFAMAITKHRHSIPGPSGSASEWKAGTGNATDRGSSRAPLPSGLVLLKLVVHKQRLRSRRNLAR